MAHGALLLLLGLFLGVGLFTLYHGLLYLGGEVHAHRVFLPRVVLVGYGVYACGLAVAFGVALGHGEHTHEYLHLTVARLPRLNVPQEHAGGGEKPRAGQIHGDVPERAFAYVEHVGGQGEGLACGDALG